MDLLKAKDGGVRSVYEPFLWNVIDEGRAIAAEIARLADLVPPYVVDPAKSRFKPVILDYNYFVKMDEHDATLSHYQDLDDEIFAENKSFLSNLLQLFDSLSSFMTTFKQYLDECAGESRLEEWDTVRELELEAFCLLGLICLSLDTLFRPITLERLVVLLFRLSDERTTGLAYALDLLHAPQHADDSLFSRVGVPIAFVEEILEAFGDRFHELQVHSSPLSRIRAHVPTLLFLCLRFRPPTLSNTPRLSRILDLFFRDQWVINVGGMVMNLVDEWSQYKLLTTLLASRIAPARARSLAEQQLSVLHAVDLPQGAISVSTIPTVTPLTAKYNTALQWLCLHRFEKAASKKTIGLLSAVKQATAGFEPHFAMATVARVEQRLITVYERTLRGKTAALEAASSEVQRLLDEMIDVLKVTPNIPIRAERKQKLIDWFGVLKIRLSEEASGPKGAEIAVEVKQRVEHAVSSVGLSLTLAAVFPRLAAALDSLFALSSLSRQHLTQVKCSAAPGYALVMIASWSSHMQLMLVNAPLPLRSLCYKLFLTVSQEVSLVHSRDRRPPIGRALSARLSRRLRSSLATLPNQIFEVIDTCIVPQLERSWPTALDKSEVRRLADIDERLKLAEGTRALGNLSIGVASLSAKSIGARPREVVADGLREELRRRLAAMVTSDLGVHEAIRRAGHEANLLRMALIAACEQLRVDGSAIWREEVAALFEREAERIVERAAKRKTWDDAWLDGEASSSSGRERTIVRMVIEATNPKRTRYIGHEQTWRDVKSGNESFSPAVLPSLESSLPSSTAALARILRTRASLKLRGLLAQLKPILPPADAPPEAIVRVGRNWSTALADELASLTQSALLADYLDQARSRSARLLLPHVSRVLDATAAYLASDGSSSRDSVARLLPLLRHLGLSPSLLSTQSLSTSATTHAITTHAALCLAIWLAEVGGARTTLACLQLPQETRSRLECLRDTVVAGRYVGKQRPAIGGLQTTIEAIE